MVYCGSEDDNIRCKSSCLQVQQECCHNRVSSNYLQNPVRSINTKLGWLAHQRGAFVGTTKQAVPSANDSFFGLVSKARYR
jgi:hypothetical protein